MIVEMSHEEVMAYHKKLDAEIKQEEIKLIKLLKEKFLTFSETNKKIVLEVIKSFSN